MAFTVVRCCVGDRDGRNRVYFRNVPWSRSAFLDHQNYRRGDF